MRVLSVLFAAGLSLGTSLPAAAAEHAIGVVNVSADHYTQVRWSNFDGPVTRLSLLPDNDAVNCDHVTINYRDGTAHDVFSGYLLRQQQETVFFPEGSSPIRDVEFACRAQSIDGARIALSAVSGEDRDIYRRADLQIEQDAIPEN